MDLQVLDANIARIAKFAAAHGKAWRPHIKGHKSPKIAQRLIDAGAIGVTCAKLGEAEVMARNGILDILIANQVSSLDKLAESQVCVHTHSLTRHDLDCWDCQTEPISETDPRHVCYDYPGC